MKWSGLLTGVAVLVGVGVGRATVTPPEPTEAQPEAVQCETTRGARAPSPKRTVRRLANNWQPPPQTEAQPDERAEALPASPRPLDPLTELLLQRADEQLARGREGHLALIRDVDQLIIRNKDRIDAMEDGQIARQLYPVLRYGMDHEADIVALMETVFETMAYDPEALADVDPKTLEIFTEGLAVMLPGAVGDDQMAVFREHAEAILAADVESQPTSVRRNRREISTALERFWSDPLTMEDVIAKLQAGPTEARDVRRLQRMLPPDELRRLDPVPIYANLFTNGDLTEADGLRHFDLDAGSLAQLDNAIYDARGPISSYHLLRYLRVTGRDLDAQRAFLEQGRGSPQAASFQAALDELNALSQNLR